VKSIFSKKPSSSSVLEQRMLAVPHCPSLREAIRNERDGSMLSIDSAVRRRPLGEALTRKDDMVRSSVAKAL
jgi:hypothetical protein